MGTHGSVSGRAVSTKSRVRLGKAAVERLNAELRAEIDQEHS